MVDADSGLLSFDVGGSLMRAIDPATAWSEADDEALKFAAMLYPQLVVCAPAEAIDSFRKRLSVDRDTDREIGQWLVPVLTLAPELAGGEVDFAPIRDQLREFAQEKQIDGDALEEALKAPAVNLRNFLGPAYLSLRHELHYHHVERPTELAHALSPLSVSPSGPNSLKAAIPELAQISWVGVMELRRDGFRRAWWPRPRSNKRSSELRASSGWESCGARSASPGRSALIIGTRPAMMPGPSSSLATRTCSSPTRTNTSSAASR